MIWLAFAALCLATIALLTVPLWRRRAAVAERLDYDLAVYQDQLAELDKEVERGTLTADQAQAARVEVQRRILTAADQGTVGSSSQGRRLMLALLVVVMVPVMGFGVYLMLGRPDMPDLPHSARADQMQQMQDQQAMIQNMVKSLQAKLEQNPNDAKGWSMLGRSLRVLGQVEQSAQAFKRAVALQPDDPQILMEYGALLLAQVPQGGALPADFVAVMRDVARLDGNNLDALYFLGIAEAQAGNNAKARDLWAKVRDKLPADSPERGEIQQQIDELK